MFEQKLRPAKPKKAKKQHGAAFYVIGVFTFAIEFMLGVNAAFLVDQSVTIVVSNMLAGTFLAPLASLITLIVSLAVGFSFVAGGMWTFTGFMDSLKDAQAYAEHNGMDGWFRWPVVAIWGLGLAVILLDLSTLMFRASYFAAKGGEALFWFFLILIPLPFLLGLIVYVLENTPRDRRLSKARQFAEQLEGDTVTGLVEEMDEDLRSRWLSGDTTAVQEHYTRVEEMREDNRLYEESQMQSREERKREKEAKRTKANQPLPTSGAPRPKRLAALPNNQAQQDGQNNQRGA
jgi:hypothetical protein